MHVNRNDSGSLNSDGRDHRVSHTPTPISNYKHNLGCHDIRKDIGSLNSDGRDHCVSHTPTPISTYKNTTKSQSLISKKIESCRNDSRGLCASYSSTSIKNTVIDLTSNDNKSLNRSLQSDSRGINSSYSPTLSVNNNSCSIKEQKKEVIPGFKVNLISNNLTRNQKRKLRRHNNILKKRKIESVNQKILFLTQKLHLLKLQLTSIDKKIVSIQKNYEYKDTSTHTKFPKDYIHLSNLYDEKDYYQLLIDKIDDLIQDSQELSSSCGRIPRYKRKLKQKLLHKSSDVTKAAETRTSSKSCKNLNLEIHFQSSEEEDNNECFSPSELSSKSLGKQMITKYNWYHDLLHFDNEEDKYCLRYLFVLQGNSSSLKTVTFKSLMQQKNTLLQSNIHNVIMIQRPIKTQIYIIQNLQKSLHFALGSIGSRKFMNLCQLKKIPISIYNNSSPVINSPCLMIDNFNHQPLSTFQSEINSKMDSLASAILPKLLLSFNKSQQQRTNYILNFGITDLKVHQEKRISLSGQRDLSLISMNTKDRFIDNISIKCIGDLCNTVSSFIYHSSELRDTFSSKNSTYNHYLQLFANQLNITDNHQLQQFCIPAISIIINNKLAPHCDSSNPIEVNEDKTLVVTKIIPRDKIDTTLSIDNNKHFKNGIPLCIVMYKRQCLLKKVQNQQKFDRYLHESHESRIGRLKLVEYLSYKVYNEVDYVGMFFSKHRHQLIHDKFKFPLSMKYYRHKVALFDEAVDKMSFWSAILHIHYMYCFKYGSTIEDTFSLIIFFCHQCNTTEIITQAMINIIIKFESRPSSKSHHLYHILSKECKRIIDKNDLCTDVGSGGSHTRFSVSNNRLYSISDLNRIIPMIQNELSKASNNFYKLKQSSTIDISNQIEQLSEKIQSLPGIGPLRACHIVQLASLIGIIPLQFYTNITANFKMKGGPINFFKNELQWKQDNIKMNYFKELSDLQELYTCNLTSNMFKNLSCILGRKKKRRDIMFHFPIFNKEKKTTSSINTNSIGVPN